MKKIISLLVVIAVVFSFCACGSSNENNVDDSVSTSVSNEPLRPEKPSRQDLEQAVVNRCCVGMVSRINITYGTFYTSWDETENEWVTHVKGTYYPIDDFGTHQIHDQRQIEVKLHGTEIVDFNIVKKK